MEVSRVCNSYMNDYTTCIHKRKYNDDPKEFSNCIPLSEYSHLESTVIRTLLLQNTLRTFSFRTLLPRTEPLIMAVNNDDPKELSYCRFLIAEHSQNPFTPQRTAYNGSFTAFYTKYKCHGISPLVTSGSS